MPNSIIVLYDSIVESGGISYQSGISNSNIVYFKIFRIFSIKLIISLQTIIGTKLFYKVQPKLLQTFKDHQMYLWAMMFMGEELGEEENLIQ